MTEIDLSSDSDTETDTAEQISSRTISRYYTIFRFDRFI